MPKQRRLFVLGVALLSVLWITWIVAVFMLTQKISPHFSSTTTLSRLKSQMSATPAEVLSNTSIRRPFGGNSANSRLPAQLNSTQERINILILASMRTGSSFVGELLGNNKDIFYLFEPGIILSKCLTRIKGGRQVIENVYLRMLQRLFQCDFKHLHFYLRWLSKLEDIQLLKIAPRLYDYCQTWSFPGNYSRRCKITEDMARNVCSGSQYVAIKCIRIPDISLVLPIIEDKATNLRVVHLVRDPRPMTASRVLATTGQALNVTDDKRQLLPNDAHEFLSIYCKYSWQNLEVGMHSPSLKHKYMLLRYEDAALDPLSAARWIYNFLGDSKVPKSVYRWVDLNTKSDGPGMFSTSRNSSRAYQSWRLTLPLTIVKEIEEVGQCRGMMERMGYHLVEDEKHLINMTLPLIGEVPIANDKKLNWLWF